MIHFSFLPHLLQHGTKAISSPSLSFQDIADVTYFVDHDSLLDIEARARSTTVYLADRRTDMLPAILSEHILFLLTIEFISQ